MREKTEMVLKLLTEGGFSISEVQNMLNLNNKEFNIILKRIRDAGYNYNKTFYSDGNIHISPCSSVYRPNQNLRINIKENNFRTLFISDLHIGSDGDQPELIKMVSNYAINHGIHSIFDAGDIIDNLYPENKYHQKNKTIHSQVNKVLQTHEYHDNLIYFNLGGNHDYKSIQDNGFDPLRYFEDRRYDMISLGYGVCYIHMKDDVIAITHDLKRNGNTKIVDNSTLVFKGHSHKSRNRDNKIIYILSLSDNDTGAYEFKPLMGFIDVNFTFYEKMIAKVDIKQLAFVNEEIRLGNEDTMILSPTYKERRKNKKKELVLKK